MYCELCTYYTEQGECCLHGKIGPEQRESGCDSYIERSFRVWGMSGSCGLSGLPFVEPPQESDDQALPQ